ncbi:restriction endonuclease subunit S [Providencia rettgeri]
MSVEVTETGLNLIPAGYKQTEVGVIPEDWETKPLGALVEIYSGDSPSKFQFSTKGIPYFKVEQLNNGSVYADTTPYFIQSSKKILAGSVIFPKRGVSILSNKIRVLKYDAFMDTNLMALTCLHGLNELYLYNQLTYRGLNSVADTTSIPQINNKHIIPYIIPLPSKLEQAAIANALSDVDLLISGLEKLIAKKQSIKTGTMQQLITGRTRLPQFALREDGSKKGTKQSELGEIPEDWKVKMVFELADCQKSLFDDGDWIEAEHITNKGIRLIQTGNIGVGRYVDKDTKKYIFKESFEKLKCKELHEGDLLICRLAEPAGRACIFPYIGEDKVITSVDVTIFRPSHEVTSREFYNQYFSSSDWFKSVLEQVGGTTHKRISRGALGRISVRYPNIEEQTAIATMLSDMDKEIQALEQRLNKTLQIKQGMMQELLTGKTRLVQGENG